MTDITAAVIKHEGKILIARRSKKNDHLAGLWEFPGGKIEPGETSEGCLAREIEEELGIRIKVGSFITETVFDYTSKRIHLMAYWAEWIYGSINPIVHDKIKWASIDELGIYTFAPANIPIVKKIIGDSNV